MKMDWYMPARLITGKGCVRNSAEQIKKFGSKCLVLTGKHSAKACGALADVEAALEEAGIAWIVSDNIGQNPKLTDCMDAAAKAASFGAEFILGIGGGSPLDAAKCTAVLAANPGMTQKELYSLKWPVKPLPVVAVGTTAGTGSEVTKVSVITIPEGLKKSFNHDDIYPALSLGDYSYTLSLTDEFTRSTAIDALAHCVESYFNRKANEITQSFAVRGIRLLIAVFDKILAEGTGALTEEDRETLYNASIYGGLAINMTGTAMPHAMGYLLTEQYHVPHGTACALYLPEFYAHNKEVVPELTERFLKEIGISEEKYLRLVKEIPPKKEVVMTEEDIAREHKRWIGNGSIAKSWGTIDADMADAILRRLFV